MPKKNSTQTTQMSDTFLPSPFSPDTFLPHSARTSPKKACLIQGQFTQWERMVVHVRLDSKEFGLYKSYKHDTRTKEDQ